MNTNTEQTYAETRKEQPFDWNRALMDAISNPPGKFELENLGERADRWVTCACSQLCAIIPRNPCGEPIDKELSNLGVEFADLVLDAEYGAALATLESIEARSAILIAEERAKL